MNSTDMILIMTLRMWWRNSWKWEKEILMNVISFLPFPFLSSFPLALILFIIIISCVRAGYWTQILSNVNSMLYQWAMCPAQKYLISKRSLTDKGTVDFKTVSTVFPFNTWASHLCCLSWSSPDGPLTYLSAHFPNFYNCRIVFTIKPSSCLSFY